MSFKGVVVNKLNGGLGRSNPTNDRDMVLVYSTPVALVGTTLYQIYELLQVADLENMGFTAELDDTESILVHQQVSEFFRLAPESKLKIMFVAEDSVADLVINATFIEAIRADGDIKIIGTQGFIDDVSDVFGFVETIQLFITNFFNEIRYIDAFLVAARGEAVPVVISAYPDFRTKSAQNVSVCIAQDALVAASNAVHENYADMACVMAMLAIRQVSENVGSVDVISKPSAKKGNRDYPLNEANSWTSAKLSDGKVVAKLTLADKKALTDKGYIYAGSYPGYGGIFFNSSPTCVELASDYASIENNCVWNKASRLLREALIPKVKGKLKKDPATGYIRSTTIASLEGLGKAALQTMEASDDISGSDVYIDPKQIVDETHPLKVKAQVVLDGIIHEISIDLGLTNKI